MSKKLPSYSVMVFEFWSFHLIIVNQYLLLMIFSKVLSPVQNVALRFRVGLNWSQELQRREGNFVHHNTDSCHCSFASNQYVPHFVVFIFLPYFFCTRGSFLLILLQKLLFCLLF